jgi:hypothetical protein
LKRKTLAIAIFCVLLLGCFKEDPVPPEVNLADVQEFGLWKAGAPLYLQESFAHYREALSKAKQELIRVRSTFRWFRDYKPVQAEFAQVLKEGEELSKLLETEKRRRAAKVLEGIQSLRERLRQMDQLTRAINEGKASRGSLTKAEVTLTEAETLYGQGRFLVSEEKLKEAEIHLAETERTITPVLSRYRDVNQITRWKRWAKEAVEESREKRIHSILVIKATRELLLYRNGELVKTYRVGLGQRGFWDKQRAKDNATPEGKYRIVGKNGRSRYYKALLINYPNEEDRREFVKAKQKGLLPAAVKIGGSIEIHGGGNEGVTYGCIALDNRQMEELYHLVDVGVPITIVGAVDDRNSLSSALKVIQNGRVEKEAP